MAQLQVEDFFNPPQDTNSKFLSGCFCNRQDLNLHTYAWLPKNGKPTAAVFVFHGFGEHAGRYRRFAHELNNHGFAVFSLDMQGHGKSAGKRGYVGRYEDYVRDACDFISKVPGVYLQLPKFLVGVGVGATIINMTVTLTHARRPGFFAGLIFISPAVKRGDGSASSGVIRRAGLFGRKVRTADPGLLSHDTEVVANYRTDSLVFHSKVKSSTASQLLKAMAWLESSRSVAKMTFPFLICQGSADQIVSPLGAKHLYDEAPSKDKQLKLYKGFYHDLLHEQGHEQVFSDIVSWIAARAETAEFTPIPAEEATPRFFPEPTAEKKKDSIISDRKASCPPDSLDDFIPGTAAPPSPAFTLDRSLSLTAPAFASVEEYDEELLLADDENAQPLISPRTLDALAKSTIRV